MIPPFAQPRPTVKHSDDVSWAESHLGQVGLVLRLADLADAAFAEFEAVAIGDWIGNSMHD